uniref:Heat shock protein 70 n=1 Tax=Panagrolaimus davidi TaxID=227884 RepID=A0A914Q3A4_9BILA
MTDVKRLKLLLKCQSLKESLSTLEKTNLDADEIDPSVETFIPITRNQFEEMSANLVQEIRLNVEKALNKINLQSYQIQKVLQVGGGCRMPMIKALLKEMFPNSEHCADQNPDEVVAIGAAYYAYYLNQKDKSKCSVM